jgi:hypothetical protein
MPRFKPEFFHSLVDVAACNERVRQRLTEVTTPEALIRFVRHYASWNACFANGVASLTSLTGSSRDLFREPGFARAVCDRANFVASHFFDAARDEYDDHINPQRDSHRCLAQATLIGMVEILGVDPILLEEPEPPALQWLNEAVMSGYTGQPLCAQGPASAIFYGMGYHLGSELLADREFSMLDEHLRAHHHDLVQSLMRHTVTLAGGQHRCYAWVGIHSGHGGGVEADHFDVAVRGVDVAFAYLCPTLQAQAEAALKAGFIQFSNDHQFFFGNLHSANRS